MDYISLCRNFFSATNIPVSLTQNGDAVYSALGETLNILSEYHRELFDANPSQNPCFCGDSPDIEYGRVQIEGTGYDLFLGPVFNVPVTEELIRQFMRELSMSLSLREQLTELLCSIPRTSHMQFARYLIFFHQCLNNKTVDLQLLLQEDEIYTRHRKTRHIDNMITDQEEENNHNTYYFELEMYQRIKEGDPAKLKKFFAGSRLALKEGKMAQSPLRHTKNLFITTAAKVGSMGAIPGGVDIEKTYQLVDYYIQECEQLQTIDEINHLMYVMVMDFCQRCGECHIPEDVSPDVYACMTYIRSHTNESISVEDAAAHVNRSSSYMMKHFKNELGIHIGAYIMRCKLEEAKSLLTYSEKTLAEISSYLCFSNQSYFQNVFKKQYGVTPLQYRKQTKGRSN